MRFQVVAYPNVAKFLDENERHLLEKESFNNLLLGLAENIRTGKMQPEKPMLLAIEERVSRRIFGQALQTAPDKPFVVSEMPLEAIPYIVGYLQAQKASIHAVVGPNEVSEAFANLWAEAQNLEAECLMNQGVYELVTVRKPDDNGGELIVAEEKHRPTLEVFMQGFVQATNRHDTALQLNRIPEVARRYLTSRDMHFWQNAEGEFVSIAAKSRESQNAATISWVYTPVEHRGKGYASCLVANLSQKLLNEGKKKCNLFTDLANPTSNSIYQKVGYTCLGYARHYVLK